MNRRRFAPARSPLVFSALGFFVCLGLCPVSHATSLADVRYDSKGDFTRFVAEFDGPFQYQNHNTLGDKSYFYIDVPRVKRGAADNQIPFSDNRVARIVSQYLPDYAVQRFIFYLKVKSPYEVNVLPGNRLVVDVLSNGRVVPGAQPRAGSVSRSVSYTSARSSSSRRIRVIINPGHGGTDPGACSRSIGGKRIKEKDITLAVSRRLVSLIEKSPNMDAYLTRTNDSHVSLAQRVRFAQAHKGDIFVSVHCNSVPSRASRRPRGVEFYYLDATGKRREATRWLREFENNEITNSSSRPTSSRSELNSLLKGIVNDRLTDTCAESRRLCLHFNHAFKKAAYFQRYNRGVKADNFHTLRGSQMPAVLLEIGFLSNKAEAQMMANNNFQDQVARLIFNGLNSFLAERDPAFQPFEVALNE